MRAIIRVASGVLWVRCLSHKLEDEMEESIVISGDTRAKNRSNQIVFVNVSTEREIS